MIVRCPHCEKIKRLKSKVLCDCGKEYKLVISKQGVIIHDKQWVK